MRPLLLCTLLLLVPVAARADLDVAIRNGDVVRGTVSPAGEVETYRIDLPQGARLKATAKPKVTSGRKFPPALRLRLLDPVGRDISAGVTAVRGKKGSVSGFEAPAAGVYAIEVRGDGFDIGDYVLSVRWNTPRRVRVKRVAIGAAATVAASVSADVGSTLKIVAKASKRSAVVPHVVDVVAPDASVVRAFSTPNPPGKKHRVEAVVRTTGEFTVRVADVAGVGGLVDLDVRVKRPAGGRRDVRVTDAELGAIPDDVDILTTVLVEPSVGGSVGEGARGDARVVVPAGAVTHLTPIQIGRAAAFDGPPGTGLLPAGQPVFLGPEHLEFARLVDVVVPYDPAALPDGTSELRIVRREASGLLSVLDANAVVADTETATASIPVGRGGTYAAFRRVPAPAPTSVTPFSGSITGGTVLTLGGSGFRDLRDPQTGLSRLEILLDGTPVFVDITRVMPTLLTFVAPPHAAGRVTFAVRDPETGLTGSLPPNAYLYE